MSMLFPPAHKGAFRLFTRKHLPAPKSFRSKLNDSLPAILRADKRYIFICPLSLNRTDNTFGFISRFEFMFFSNPEGKILVLEENTLSAGKGTVTKTTANPSYLNTMKNEALTINTISNNSVMKGNIPNIISEFSIANRHYIIEE